MTLKMSRREFLKFSSAALLLANINWSRALQAAIESVKSSEVKLVWLEVQDCAGDTTALIQGTDPDVVQVLTGASHVVGPGSIHLSFHQTIMPEWGENAVEILRKAEKGELDKYVLILEGSFPDEEFAAKSGGWYCVLGEEDGRLVTCNEWLKRLLKRAVAVVAIGNCACYGGLVADKVYEGSPDLEIPTQSPSPTGAIGFFDDPIRGYKGMISRLEEARPFKNFIEGRGRPRLEPDSDCKPAIAVPGCPTNGNAQLKVLANVILAVKGLLPLPELDSYWRPKFIYGLTVHETCPRAAWYSAGLFRKQPGEPSGACLYEVGCKGPISNCPWNKVGWVNGVGGPTRTGGVCIGCTMPGFTDAYEPFYKPLQAPLPPDLTTLGTIGGVAAAAGLAAGFLLPRKLKEREKEEKEGESE